MNISFKAVTLSYKSAPLHIRESIALDEQTIKRLMNFLKEFTDMSDVLVLSTCNRTEVYYSSDKNHFEEIVKLIGIEKGLDNMQDFKPYFNSIDNSFEAVKYLFRVSMGLEAQVVGDMQIANQVKRAYQQSADLGLAGPYLHRLMHTIFFTNKRVVQETSFRDGAASVSYAAAELVEELASEIVNPRILVLGLGEIGEDVCRNLVNRPFKNIAVCNRTLSKAETLAAECNFELASFDHVLEEIKNADVIVSSLGLGHAFITKEMVSQFEILSYKYFIDLSVPRNVEPEVEEIPGALVYNIDTIENRASEALEKRIAAIPQVESIIDEVLEEFKDWTKEMEVSPTIHKLMNALENIRQEELARFVKDLNEEESQKVERITKSMMQKIIKLPVLQLKAACKRGEAETLIDVLNNLFDLEKQPSKIIK